MKKLVIFDLDGTLLNTLDDLADCTNYILRKYGHPEHPVDAYRYFVGRGIQKMLEQVLPEKNRSEAYIAQILSDFMLYYEIHKEDKTDSYQGLLLCMIY